MGGKTEILPEMILAEGKELWSRLHQLAVDVWVERKVVADWQDVQIVPIPKKGDLRVCDNWRGISLLDVVGKIFAKSVQERLQIIANKVLPKPQCGFRRGRGCTNMIFVARQLIEKADEHGDALFIELQKAYDSVPRQALWQVLQKCGVPPAMLHIIRSFHDGMHAEVRLGNTVTASFEERSGLRQGCTVPTLFNIYCSAMMADWQSRCPQAGVTLRFRHGQKLVGDRTAKSRLSTTRITESQFADDAAVYAATWEAFEQATTEFVQTASRWGLTVNIRRTKGVAVGRLIPAPDTRPVQLEDGEVEMVNEFTYLGSCVISDGDLNREVRGRIANAARVFGCLKVPIFQSNHLSIEIKRNVYRAVVLGTLLYGAETCTVKAEHLRCLTTFHNRCVRTILGVSKYQQWMEKITTGQLAVAFGMEETMANILMPHRLRWLGHLARMEDHRMPKQLLFGELVRTGPRHGPKRRWRDVVRSDLQAIGVSVDEWYAVAQHRLEWLQVCTDGVRTVVDQCQQSECPANRASVADNFPCPCGRPFRGKGGRRTRHRRFAPKLSTSHLVHGKPKDPAITYEWAASKFKVQGVCVCVLCVCVCVRVCVCVCVCVHACVHVCVCQIDYVPSILGLFALASSVWSGGGGGLGVF